MTTIHIAHSPDADDAFMFYPLIQGKIDREGLEFVEVREDIETLNQKAMQGTYEVTAISFHVYPYISDRYLFLSTGACFGDHYGPIVVAAKSLKPKQLLKVRMGIPGKMTSAFLALKLYEHFLAGEAKSGICYSQVPFDKIMDDVKEGKIDAGLIIHEGQLSFAEKGLHRVVDLGEWWGKETGLPLPLGGIAIRRDLDPALTRQIASLIQKSVQYALEHKEESLEQALSYARGLDAEKALKFIEMYVNEMTIDFGRKGYKAIKAFLDRGYRAGILTQSVDLDGCLFDVKRGRVRGAGEPVDVPAETPTPVSAPESAPEPVVSPEQAMISPPTPTTLLETPTPIELLQEPTPAAIPLEESTARMDNPDNPEET